MCVERGLIPTAKVAIDREHLWMISVGYHSNQYCMCSMFGNRLQCRMGTGV